MSDRTRARGVLIKLCAHPGRHFLKFDIAAQRLVTGARNLPRGRAGYVALARCYRRLKSVAGSDRTYERHISERGTARPRSRLPLIAQVYSEEVGDVDRAIDAHQHPSIWTSRTFAALDALSKLYEKQGCGARHRVDDARGGPDDRRQPARRDVLSHRALARGKPSAIASSQERFEMALDLDPAHLPSLAALPPLPSTKRLGSRSRATSNKSR